jgi:hypothetical protein
MTSRLRLMLVGITPAVTNLAVSLEDGFGVEAETRKCLPDLGR